MSSSTLPFSLILIFGVLMVAVLDALPPDEPIEGKDLNTIIGKGMDVNWCKTGKSIREYSPVKLHILKEYGYDHIRIRTHVESFTNNASFILHVERVINDTLAMDMIPIFAMIGDQFKEDPTQGNLQTFLNTWEMLADRWQNYTHKLIFDVMIEPGKALGGDMLNKMFADAGTVIRPTNPTRLLSIAPDEFANPRALDKLEVPDSYGTRYWFLESHMFASGPQQKGKELWPAKDETKKLIHHARKWAHDRGTVWWWGAIHAQNHDSPPWSQGEECLHFVQFIMNQRKEDNNTWSIAWEVPSDFWAPPGLNGTNWTSPLMEEVQHIITKH